VRNILDEEALEGAIDFNNLTGFVNEPRTYGVQVRWDF
jgi:iron complex outermembrane receptor protein